eukprot:TRINITY_DN18183_c0_g1_i1.p1 TRINITY_DN18183_c0_g1~~TRINITY_DN18183_c0_g1_i1.p1  ORF type:complete len:192 (-),score=27.47 TRINITY_DN18183_c0_g1_i1:262-837(-)
MEGWLRLNKNEKDVSTSLIEWKKFYFILENERVPCLVYYRNVTKKKRRVVLLSEVKGIDCKIGEEFIIFLYKKDRERLSMSADIWQENEEWYYNLKQLIPDVSLIDNKLLSYCYFKNSQYFQRLTGMGGRVFFSLKLEIRVLHEIPKTKGGVLQGRKVLEDKGGSKLFWGMQMVPSVGWLETVVRCCEYSK